MRVEWKHKLSVKLILVISGILLANLAYYTYFTTSHLESNLTLAYSQNALNLSNVIKKSTRYSMLLNRSEDVYHIVNTIGKEKDVVRIRIYNKTGTIMFTTDSSETNHTVDANAEACIICHTSSKVFSSVPVENRIRVYTDADGKKMMGLVNPIENEKDCYNSSCHAHAAGQEILGVLDVVISIENVERIIRTNTKNIIYNSVAVTAVISVFCGLFITIMVNRPLNLINKGMREIGRGNLNYKIGLQTNDELGDMAQQFNDMSAKLDRAYREIKDWSETLNNKVNQKSEELKKVYDQIVQIEKLASLGKLSATVAHELNNPLEGILTYSKLIAKQLQKRQKENEFHKALSYLAMISDESARCGKIVKDLLIFSHRDEEAFVQGDLHDLIRKCITLIGHHLELHRIEVVEKFEASSSMIDCNPHKIQQAVLALLMNAIEAINNNGSITIHTATKDKQVMIRVCDTGPGIQPGDLPHIFDPFYTTKTGGKGTGLGLAVVYGIIHHHHGTVNVEATSPQGTEFLVTLPLPDKTEV